MDVTAETESITRRRYATCLFLSRDNAVECPNLVYIDGLSGLRRIKAPGLSAANQMIKATRWAHL